MIKIIVKDVEYDFTADDINYDEFKVYEGSEEDYIKEQKALLKEQLGTQFEYECAEEYTLYNQDEITELLEKTANCISDDTGWLCTITDYEIIKIYDDEDTKEVIKDRGKKKEFYVMHYNPEKGIDSLYEKLEFKTYKQALKEFYETPVRKEYGMVEIIFSPEDEEYSDNMEVAVKV